MAGGGVFFFDRSIELLVRQLVAQALSPAATWPRNLELSRELVHISLQPNSNGNGNTAEL